jgi:Flp pilus assembly protein TadD
MLGSIFGDLAMWRIQTVALEPAAQSHWDGAMADLLLALEFDPESLNATINMVYMLLRTGDNNAAVGYAQRAVELGPEQPQSWIALGKAAQAVGNMEEAQRAFGRAKELMR